jgi:hypothetical protein
VITSTGNNVEIFGIRRGEKTIDLFDDQFSLTLDGAWGEHLVDQIAHPAMLGRIHHDDQRRHRITGLHHLEIDSARRRERFGIFDGRHHIGVPGQRVEIVILAVVDRLLIAHPTVGGEGGIEEVAGKRIKHDFRSSQRVLLVFTSERTSVRSADKPAAARISRLPAAGSASGNM